MYCVYEGIIVRFIETIIFLFKYYFFHKKEIRKRVNILKNYGVTISRNSEFIDIRSFKVFYEHRIYHYDGVEIIYVHDSSLKVYIQKSFLEIPMLPDYILSNIEELEAEMKRYKS